MFLEEHSRERIASSNDEITINNRETSVENKSLLVRFLNIFAKYSSGKIQEEKLSIHLDVGTKMMINDRTTPANQMDDIIDVTTIETTGHVY